MDKIFLATMSSKCKDEYKKMHSKRKIENLARSDQDLQPMTEVMKVVLNDTAKLFFNRWVTAV